MTLRIDDLVNDGDLVAFGLESFRDLGYYFIHRHSPPWYSQSVADKSVAQQGAIFLKSPIFKHECQTSFFLNHPFSHTNVKRLFLSLEDINPFYGATDTCFGLLVMAVLDFKPRVDSLACQLCGNHVIDSSDSPLVQHLLTS